MIKRRKFDNGLVLLTEKTNAKKAMLMVGIKVGSVNENERLNGASHFNEHMLFKSNKYRTARQINEDLEYSGAKINAFTSHGITAFWAKSLPSELDQILRIAYEAATNFDYDEKELKTERGVILSEIQRGDDDATAHSRKRIFMPILFKGSPLERSIAGTLKTMSEVTKKELEEFKRVYYVPNNMAIIAVGNFNERKLIKKIKNTFAKISPQNISYEDFKISLKNNQNTVIKKRKEINQAYFWLGYKVPGCSHKDYIKLSILDDILSAGMSSRLFRKLREEKGIGYAVGNIFWNIKNAAVFSSYIAGFDPGRFDEAKDVILRGYADLKTNLVSDKEFKGTKTIAISQYYDMLPEIEFRAREILSSEFNKTPYDFRKLDKYMQKVTKKELRETANKYLSEDYTLAALVPEDFQAK